MTAPRRPRHALSDTGRIPAPRTGPVDPPTEAMPVVPAQRAARFPDPPVGAPVPNRAGMVLPAPRPPAPAWPVREHPVPAAAVPGPRARVVPAVLAGVTALVLGLGVTAVAVQSGGPAGGVPVSGR